jgi:hypothetical protein
VTETQLQQPAVTSAGHEFSQRNNTQLCSHQGYESEGLLENNTVNSIPHISLKAT